VIQSWVDASGGNTTSHLPCKQTCPGPQLVPALAPWQFPDAPQNSLFVIGSMQAPLQTTSPALRRGEHTATHCPLAQGVPGWQLTPQPPQFWGSDSGSTQTMPQSRRPGPQMGTQVAFAQAVLAGHAWPHEPQFASSTERSAHVPPASDGHRVTAGPPQSVQHAPFEQMCPAVQPAPHAPQLSTFELRSTQTAPHEVRGERHAATSAAASPPELVSAPASLVGAVTVSSGASRTPPSCTDAVRPPHEASTTDATMAAARM